MKINRVLYLLTLSVSTSMVGQDTIPAFPTAEGYGMWASGGRGGKVVEVTSLEDKTRSGAVAEGGFRWALQQYPGEPITIVFKVSGIIDLEGQELRSKRSDITIAGQTAPGDGICIKGGKVNLGGSFNVIMRHLRFRVGLLDNGSFIEGGALGYENGGNFIIDHCTFGWSGEENMTIYDNNDITIQWCILHEGLYDVGHPKGVRGYGCQWGSQTSTFHHNLLAHNVNRTPRVNGARSNDHNVTMDYVNNVNYNWGKENSAYGGDFDGSGQSHHCNWVNNYYKPGPARPGTSSSYFVQSSFNPSQTVSQIAVWYMDGNQMEGSANSAKNSDNYLGLDASAYTGQGVDKSSMMAAEAFEVPYSLEVESAEDAYNTVLTKSGAFPRDAVDTRIVGEVETGTAPGSGNYGSGKGMIDDPETVGGFPTYDTYNIVADNDHDGIGDYWELANGMDTTDAEDRNTLTSEGYTYLEAYLNGLVGEYLAGLEYPDPEYIDAHEPLGTPNPHFEIHAYVDSSSHLIIESNLKVKKVILFDVNGRVVGKYEGKALNDISVSNLPKGLYVSRIETDNGYVGTLKFIR